VLRTRIILVAVGLIGSIGTLAVACNVSFSYNAITAPVGAYGEIVIRVQKSPARCVLSSMDEYTIAGGGVQILGQVVWEEVGSNLYETWIALSLASVGDGWLSISRFCTKEGYEKGLLPVSVEEAPDNGTWGIAWGGVYPFETEADVATAVGSATFVQSGTSHAWIEVGGIQVDIPDASLLPDMLPQRVRLFYTELTDGPVALLIVGDGVFIRFDHLVF